VTSNPQRTANKFTKQEAKKELKETVPVRTSKTPPTVIQEPEERIPTEPQLWIRIRKEPKLFAGSGSVPRGYGSGSETGLKSY
jgi:hypothetical protein